MEQKTETQERMEIKEKKTQMKGGWKKRTGSSRRTCRSSREEHERYRRKGGGNGRGRNEEEEKEVEEEKAKEEN